MPTPPPTRADVPDDVLAAFHDIDRRLPAGFRTQIVDGEIVVSHLPDGEHAGIVADLCEQVAHRATHRLHCSGHRGILVPGGRYIPDCTVAPAGHFRGQASWAPASGVAMVVEVTTGTADRDRIRKPSGYAAAGIPLYLVIDRAARETVLYSRPDDGAYHGQLREPFGKGLELPPPFTFMLDTAGFG